LLLELRGWPDGEHDAVLERQVAQRSPPGLFRTDAPDAIRKAGDLGQVVAVDPGVDDPVGPMVSRERGNSPAR
jgi:hypothetical protein